MAASFLVNFAVFGENTGRMATALRTRYGLTAEQTAFFDFFAAPVPGFEEAALAVIAEGLAHGAEPRLVKRSARLLQAYEKDFWDAVAEPRGLTSGQCHCAGVRADPRGAARSGDGGRYRVPVRHGRHPRGAGSRPGGPSEVP